MHDIEYEDKDNESVVTEIEDILRHQKHIDGWIKNKKRHTYGCHNHLCGKPLKSGEKCTNVQFDKSGCYSGCRIHYVWEEKEDKLFTFVCL